MLRSRQTAVTEQNLLAKPSRSFSAYCRTRYRAARKSVLPDGEYFKLFRFLRREDESSFGARHRDTLVLLIAVSLASLSGVPLPVIGVIFGKIINEFPPQEDSLRAKLIQMMVVAAVNFFAIWGYTYCWSYIGVRIGQRIRTVVLDRVLHMDIAYHDTRKVDLSSYLMVDVQTVQTGVGEKVGIFIQSISYFLAAVVVGFVLNARFTALLMAVVIPSILVVTVVCERLNRRFTDNLAENSTRASQMLADVVRMITVVQAFGVAGLFREKNQKILEQGRYYGVRRAFVTAARLGFLFFLAYGVNSLAFWYGIRQVKANQSDAGTIYTIIFLMLDASFVISQFGPFLHIFSLAAAAGQRIDQLLQDAKEHSSHHNQPDTQPDGFNYFQLYTLQFTDICFAYPTRPDIDVLKDVNLTIPPGSFTAIVGKSGSGKSSLTALLLRFYRPTAGTLYLNGTDVSALSVKEYRRHVAYVGQDPVLFSGTIRENILHGLPDAEQLSEAECSVQCVEAAELANARAFIEALPDGYDTVVGPDGASQLSGGQVARVALARALVARPRVLVMDEVTASLDIHSENVVMAAIRRLHEETSMTILMVTHRLASVQTADQILVMAAGEVLEAGTHAELLSAGGAYSELLAMQRNSGSAESSPGAMAEKSARAAEKAAAEVVEVEADVAEILQRNSVCLPGAPCASSSMRRVLGMCRPDWLIIFAGIFSSMLTGSLVVAESVLFGYIISCLRNEPPARGPQDPNFYCLMFFVVGVVALLAHTAAGLCFGVVSERLVQRLRDRCFHSITHQDLSFFTDPAHTETALVASVQSDTAALAALSGVMIGTLFSVFTTLVGGVVVGHVIAWKIAVVLLPALPVIMAAGYLRLQVLMKAQTIAETAYVRATSIAAEAVNAVRTVASLVREQGVMQEYAEELRRAEAGHRRFMLQGSAVMALALSIGFFVYALAYWWGSRLVRAGEFSILQFFIVLPALLFSAQTAGQVFSLAPEVTRAAAAARRIFALLDARPCIAAGNGSSSSSGGGAGGSPTAVTTGGASSEKSAVSAGESGAIEFRDVSFSYPTRPGVMVLRGVSLRIRPGEFVAIVGDSGSGKSSLLALLQRFYDPTGGAVAVGGEDVRGVAVAAHRRRIAMLSQDLTLFSESILFNIAVGLVDALLDTTRDADPSAVRRAVEAACQKVGMHEFIMSLPEGYATRCTRSGAGLSGGQIQRLALARALVRDPQILVLDEPTSALDVCSEETVMRAVLEARGGAQGRRTVVMVAHRLATVVAADRIVVMRRGKVAEVGTHDELMARGGVYAGMAMQQGL